MPQGPEDIAREKIDRMLTQAGWNVQDVGQTNLYARKNVALRKQAGLSQKNLTKLLKISQQQISRLESPDCKSHSLSTLRRVAEDQHTRVRMTFEPEENGAGMRMAETAATYRSKRAYSRRVASETGNVKSKDLTVRSNN